MTEIEHL